MRDGCGGANSSAPPDRLFMSELLSNSPIVDWLPSVYFRAMTNTTPCLAILKLLLLGALLTGSALGTDSVVLFDGTSLDHWDVISCEVEIQDGALLLKAGNGLVQSKNQYRDFVLEYEWKALSPENYDSGLYFRYVEIPEGRPWPSRYQVNLRFDMMGDLVGLEGGKNRVSTQVGEWNRFELTVKGTKASLMVNGTPSWTVDGLEQPSGYVAIQAEVPNGGQFLFRNIRVTELTASE